MFSHMAWAIKQPINDALAKWTLVTLCDFTNQDGKCWPSQAILQERTAMGRSTLNKKLKLLEEQGYIKRFSGKTGFTTEYFVLTETVQQRDIPVSERDTKQSGNNNTKKRRRSVPDDWQPDQDQIDKINDLAQQQGVTLDHDYETATFRDHHISKQSVFADVGRAYGVWCRRSIRFAAQRSPQSSYGGKRSQQGNKLSDRFGAFVNTIDF